MRLLCFVMLLLLGHSIHAADSFLYWGLNVKVAGPWTSTKNKKPAVLLLHGCKIGSNDILKITEFENYATANGFVVLAPEQSTLLNSDKCWNWFLSHNQTSQSLAGETATLISLVKDSIPRMNLDQNKIFVVGFSSGAAQAANLAFCYSDVFAGALIHSGVPFKAATTVTDAIQTIENGPKKKNYGQLAYACSKTPYKKQKLKYALIVHGQKDRRVLPVNSETLLKQTADFYDLSDDQIINTQYTKTIKHWNFLRSRTATLEEWESHDSQVIKFVRVDEMDHKWSGSKYKSPYTYEYGPEITKMFITDLGL